GTPGTGSVSVLLGNGDGTFQPAKTTLTGGDGPLAVAVEDFNRDGKPDVAVTGYTVFLTGGSGSSDCGCYDCNAFSEVTLMMGTGDGTFTPGGSFNLNGDYAPSITAADLNGDGKIDLAWADSTQNAISAVSVLLGNGDGSFALTAQSFATDVDARSVIVA